MATSKKIGRTEVIELVDGTEVTLRPLNIKTLKKFMKKFGEIDSIDKDSDDFNSAFMDILVDMSAISLSSQLPDATAYLDMDPDGEEYEEARGLFEEKVDQESVAFINEICGGISFGDTNGDFPRGIEE